MLMLKEGDGTHFHLECQEKNTSWCVNGVLDTKALL